MAPSQQEMNAFTESGLDEISKRARRSVPPPRRRHAQAGHSLLPSIFKPQYNDVFIDATVLYGALRDKVGRDPFHIDFRKKLLIHDFDPSFEPLIGIVLSIVVKKYFWKARHWVALKKINGVWYKLDSDHSSPKPFQNTSAVHTYLTSVRVNNDGQIFLVRDIQQAF